MGTLRAVLPCPVLTRHCAATAPASTSTPPQLHGAKGLDSSWARLAVTAPAGATQLKLDSAALASWAPGDELALASSDFDPYQTERLKVVSVSGSTLRIKPALQYMHYGAVRTAVLHPWVVPLPAADRLAHCIIY